MDKVFISDLRVNAIIGIDRREREEPQEVVINVVLFTDVSRAGRTDDIADCVNYQTVADAVRAHAERARRFTVEALAADVAGIALAAPGVRRVLVRVEKTAAVALTRAVGVEIERDRDEPVAAT